MNQLADYRTQIDKLLAKRNHATQRLLEERDALESADARVLDVTAAQQIVQQVAQTIQQQAHDRIASVVTRCLRAVFDEPYKFRIVFERKRGRTEARLIFIRNKAEISPLKASGGGVVDVAAFALRLACLLLSRPALRRLVVLDEPFKFVSAEYRPRVREMLETLAEDLSIQFIMVTHIEELQTGTVIEVK